VEGWFLHVGLKRLDTWFASVCASVCVCKSVCVCVCVNTKTLGDGLVTACGAEVATDVRFVGVYE
jgi:hypothetical protein